MINIWTISATYAPNKWTYGNALIMSPKRFNSSGLNGWKIVSVQRSKMSWNEKFTTFKTRVVVGFTVHRKKMGSPCQRMTDVKNANTASVKKC